MTKEELKQEAEEWLCNNLHSASEEDFIKAMVDIAEPREKRIAELEKENAELKHTTATLRQEKDNSNAHTKAMEIVAKTRTDQLTKAKEIIKEFMKYEINEYDGSLEIHFEELKKQAEQFLSEVEK